MDFLKNSDLLVKTEPTKGRRTRTHTHTKPYDTRMEFLRAIVIHTTGPLFILNENKKLKGSGH